MKYLKNQKITKSNLVLELFKEFIFAKKKNFFFEALLETFEGFLETKTIFYRRKRYIFWKYSSRPFIWHPSQVSLNFVKNHGQGGGEGAPVFLF